MLLGFGHSRIMMMDISESMMLHDFEHLVNRLVVRNGGMTNNRVKLVDHFVVSDVLLDPWSLEGKYHVMVQEFFNIVNPAKVFAMHNFKVIHHGFFEIVGMEMLVQEGKNLLEQFLLMQVIEFQGGIHLVDDGVFVNKSWKGIHNSSD